MKIEISDEGEVILFDVNVPVYIVTERGRYTVCEREGLLELGRYGRIIEKQLSTFPLPGRRFYPV